ncbi:hypothetical protein, partial [Caldisalinibacter kiritimatiensis]|uniref:hypothetical protein n=1 Tax=Caldisalinibacter kiritimatiensis TaxID=1304284 RepID=UPI00055766A7
MHEGAAINLLQFKDIKLESQKSYSKKERNESSDFSQILSKETNKTTNNDAKKISSKPNTKEIQEKTKEKKSEKKEGRDKINKSEMKDTIELEKEIDVTDSDNVKEIITMLEKLERQLEDCVANIDELNKDQLDTEGIKELLFIVNNLINNINGKLLNENEISTEEIIKLNKLLKEIDTSLNNNEILFEIKDNKVSTKNQVLLEIKNISKNIENLITEIESYNQNKDIRTLYVKESVEITEVSKDKSNSRATKSSENSSKESKSELSNKKNSILNKS